MGGTPATAAPAAAGAPAASGRPGSGGRRLSRMEASARADEEEGGCTREKERVRDPTRSI